ncbi:MULTISPECIES: hypothetical protein [Pirellulaceae]|uniref:hypothetical protein n=1 Tax=Pirellulaceae TaxID=2691357 RepID=UPI001304B364|nr:MULTISPECIES: hypothetical protein [Pirellulaceae]
MSDQPTNRWAFPTFPVPSFDDHSQIIGNVEKRWHLRVRPLASEPVATLRRSRNEEPGVIWAFPVHYLGKHWDAEGAVDYRYRWCLLEEAQRRIRRKPLQRIIQDVHREYADKVPLHSDI